MSKNGMSKNGMSKDLEKLGEGLRKMQPSKSSRAQAMEAAMSAFSDEFLPETAAAKINAAAENNLNSSQGTAAEPRPTGQTARGGRVQTFGRDAMAKFNQIINFKPQTMMMAGTCAAALIAGLIIVPNLSDSGLGDGTETVPSVEAVAQNDTALEKAPELSVDEISPAPSAAPETSRRDTVVPEAKISEEETNKSVAAARSNDVVGAVRSQDSVTSQDENLTESQDAPAQTIVVERRVVKTPASTVERNVPAVTKTQTRRFEKADGTFETVNETVAVQEASTELVTIPAVYETLKETIEVAPDGTRTVVSSEIVPPATALKGGISSVDSLLNEVNSNSAKVGRENELRVREFEQRAASRTSNLTAPAPAVQFAPQVNSGFVDNRAATPAQARAPRERQQGVFVPSATLPKKIDGLTVEEIPGVGGRVNLKTRGQFTVFNGVSNQVVESTETVVNQTGEILARAMIPAKYKTVTKQVLVTPPRSEKVVIPAVTKDIIVKRANADGTFREEIETIVIAEERTDYVITPAVYETRSERVLIEPALEEWKPDSQAVNSVAFGGGLNNYSPSGPPKIVLRNDEGTIVREFESRDDFDIFSADLPVKVAGFRVEKSAPRFETKTETIVIQPASVEHINKPPVLETYTETVVLQDASTELVVIPPEYKWVDGEIEGSTIELVTIPATYETVSETVVVQPASVEYVSVPAAYEAVKETIVVQPTFVKPDGTISPAVTEEISRRVVKTPASTVEKSIPALTKQVSRRVIKTPRKTVERVVPYETKDGKTRVVVKPATVQERVVPAVPFQVTRHRIKTPAATFERTIPAITKQVQVKVIAPQTIVLRDDDGNIVREFESRDKFEKYVANLPTPVEEKPVSTFSVDVDTASYSFLRASVNSGKIPPHESIRLEEMINYFPYDYDAPKSAEEPFRANVTVTPTPWNADTKLMHIGIKGYVPKEVEKPRNNLVFLIDTSGSMNKSNKLPLLINSFKLLLNTLDKDDTVSIVTYASSTGTVLEPTRVKHKSDILAALKQLRARGSTAGAAGLQLAYENAEKSFDDEANNRVILATDGDFNVGFSSPAEMKSFISEKRETGISLSVLGFGQGNYNDALMQSLAQNGNGIAAYIDTLSEAQKVLANEAGSALVTIAKDVKIQVEFNPATVAEYRLIGYETRALKRQDFNNDKVDAGEIGAGHSVTAIYEMTPVGSPAVTMDKLRYVSGDTATATGSDEYAYVKIRHKLPNADTSTLQTFPVGPRRETSLRRASDDMRFASAVAIVGQKLRGDPQVDDYSYEDAIKLATKAKGKDEKGYRAEFIQMVRLIDGLGE